ncbi:MAG TPA: FHA domain-containing protein [Myxococcales bacterium]|nr:FHA domain-containing protein [Myxococcales bacterium]HIN85790.1 FHA domain-containing protein [Myxococcales bacterium]
MHCSECSAEITTQSGICPRCGAAGKSPSVVESDESMAKHTTRRPIFGNANARIQQDLFTRYKQMLVEQGFDPKNVERTGWYVEINDQKFHLVEGDRHVFGRHSDCEIHVDDEFVSRRHLEFVAGRTEFTMLVLKPDNPPTIADMKVPGAEVIRPEDCPVRVRAGETYLEIHCQPGTLLNALIEQHQL